jgi:hypothetical protein
MPFDENDYHQRNDALEKLHKVIALLAIEDRWCKFFGMSSDGRRCLWGALWAEDAVTILEAPVLRAIEQVTGYRYESIDAFNDHPTTTHAMVLAVLHRARQDLQMATSPSAPRYRWLPAPFRQACSPRGQLHRNFALMAPSRARTADAHECAPFRV